MKRSLLVISMVLISSIPQVLAKESGSWTPHEEFAQANAACYRVYSCGPSTDQLYADNLKLVTSPPEVSWGVCTGFDSCDACNTNPPNTACEWELVPK